MNNARDVESRHSVTRWILVSRLMVFLVVGSVLQRFIPMPRWGNLLGAVHQVPKNSDQQSPQLVQNQSNGELAKAIDHASRLLPWTPSCLAQAFAGQRILISRRQASAVVIGVMPKADVQWPTHAWLLSGGQIISGGSIAHQFSPVSIHAWGNLAEALEGSTAP